jgi:hypothetical protein
VKEDTHEKNVKKSNMGKKRKLEDREIKKTVSREKLLKISKRKLKQVKRVKHLIHRTVLIQNTITYLKHTEVEHEVFNSNTYICITYFYMESLL